jgi:hypothetical protein
MISSPFSDVAFQRKIPKNFLKRHGLKKVLGGGPGGGGASFGFSEFEWLFSRVFASQWVGPGLIPGRDMSVLGPLI